MSSSFPGGMELSCLPGPSMEGTLSLSRSGSGRGNLSREAARSSEDVNDAANDEVKAAPADAGTLVTIRTLPGAASPSPAWPTPAIAGRPPGTLLSARDVPNPVGRMIIVSPRQSASRHGSPGTHVGTHGSSAHPSDGSLHPSRQAEGSLRAAGSLASQAAQLQTHHASSASRHRDCAGPPWPGHDSSLPRVHDLAGGSRTRPGDPSVDGRHGHIHTHPHTTHLVGGSAPGPIPGLARNSRREGQSSTFKAVRRGMRWSKDDDVLGTLALQDQRRQDSSGSSLMQAVGERLSKARAHFLREATSVTFEHPFSVSVLSAGLLVATAFWHHAVSLRLCRSDSHSWDDVFAPVSSTVPCRAAQGLSLTTLAILASATVLIPILHILSAPFDLSFLLPLASAVSPLTLVPSAGVLASAGAQLEAADVASLALGIGILTALTTAQSPALRIIAAATGAASLLSLGADPTIWNSARLATHFPVPWAALASSAALCAVVSLTGARVLGVGDAVLGAGDPSRSSGPSRKALPVLDPSVARPRDLRDVDSMAAALRGRTWAGALWDAMVGAGLWICDVRDAAVRVCTARGLVTYVVAWLGAVVGLVTLAVALVSGTEIRVRAAWALLLALLWAAQRKAAADSIKFRDSVIQNIVPRDVADALIRNARPVTDAKRVAPAPGPVVADPSHIGLASPTFGKIRSVMSPEGTSMRSNAVQASSTVFAAMRMEWRKANLNAGGLESPSTHVAPVSIQPVASSPIHEPRHRPFPSRGPSQHRRIAPGNTEARTDTRARASLGGFLASVHSSLAGKSRSGRRSLDGSGGAGSAGTPTDRVTTRGIVSGAPETAEEGTSIGRVKGLRRATAEDHVRASSPLARSEGTSVGGHAARAAAARARRQGHLGPPGQSLVYFREYEEVTMVFSDVVSYTDMSSRSAPLNVLSMLHTYFSKLDAMVEALGAYKYETVGDAYVVAVNLHQPQPAHELLALRIAMAMVASACQVDKADGSGPIEIRVGIHTGPVAGGVIGVKRTLLTLCGDTLNVAARMESNSRSNHIRMTAQTAAALPPEIHETLERETIDVKGKGLMETFVAYGLDKSLARLVSAYTSGAVATAATSVPTLTPTASSTALRRSVDGNASEGA